MEEYPSTISIRLGTEKIRVADYYGVQSNSYYFEESNWCYLSDYVNGRQLIHYLLRWLGRTCDDPIVQQDSKLFPKRFINDNNIPKLKFEDVDEDERFLKKTISASGAAAMLFGELKKELIEGKIPNAAAVMIVPNDFGEPQRQALWAAIEKSGLNVTNIASQATAIGYYFNTVINEIPYHWKEGVRTCEHEEGTFLFFHLGSGSLDATVVRVDERNKSVEIKSATGDSHLGGMDFTDRLHDLFNEYRERYRSFYALDYSDIEDLKHTLSYEESVLIPIHSDALFKFKRSIRLKDDIARIEHFLTVPQRKGKTGWRNLLSEYQTQLKEIKPVDKSCGFELSRKQFEEMCADLFDRIKQHVEKAIEEAGIERSDYKEIKLYGQASIMSKVLEILRESLPGVPINLDAIERCPRKFELVSKYSIYQSTRTLFSRYDLEGAACMSHIINEKDRLICKPLKKVRKLLPQYMDGDSFVTPFRELRVGNGTSEPSLTSHL